MTNDSEATPSRGLGYRLVIHPTDICMNQLRAVSRRNTFGWPVRRDLDEASPLSIYAPTFENSFRNVASCSTMRSLRQPSADFAKTLGSPISLCTGSLPSTSLTSRGKYIQAGTKPLPWHITVKPCSLKGKEAHNMRARKMVPNRFIISAQRPLWSRSRVMK